MKEKSNMEDSVWLEVRDCKNSEMLVGLFCRASGVRKEQERWRCE